MNDKPSRMDYRQHQAARRLVHECCNYDEGNCLLLDDGEMCIRDSPTTAVPFTTNEPQSYVLGGRNHPLHINSWFDMELLSPCNSSSWDNLG